jgi:DNA-binding response OmpR family regulator
MRVRVVEDSRALANVLAEGLHDPGMAVDAARDGLEAVTKLDGTAYDVVVLDRDLPGIHGDTLCQMITERDGRVMVLRRKLGDPPVIVTRPGVGYRVAG